MKRKSRYANMNASDLARITSERGLEKPKVITLSEWADFLDADDAKRVTAENTETVTRSVSQSEAGTDADTDARAQDTIDNLKSKSSAKAKDK